MEATLLVLMLRKRLENANRFIPPKTPFLCLFSYSVKKRKYAIYNIYTLNIA